MNDIEAEFAIVVKGSGHNPGHVSQPIILEYHRCGQPGMTNSFPSVVEDIGLRTCGMRNR